MATSSAVITRADGGQEDLVQAGRSRRRKALIQGLGAHLDTQSGRCLGEFF
jgi:hypothetical protein